MIYRYPESEILYQVLPLLSMQESGSLNTSEIINELEFRLDPTGQDAEILEGRSDTYFSQKVRNIISHRNENSGIVSRGLAIFDDTTKPGRLIITKEGREFVQ